MGLVCQAGLWNSNGDFRLWSDVGYRSSVQDGILAGELKILLLTIYKK